MLTNKNNNDIIYIRDKERENKKMKTVENNLTYKNLVKTDWINQFNEKQQKEILKGLKNNIDVSWYAKRAFDWIQMKEIRTGLEHNLDVSKYANEVFKWSQMREIREGLHDDLDVSIYANPTLSNEQMRTLRFSLIEELETV